MSIRTVNLVWEKRFRQTYPVAPYALHDDGTVALALPRPLEARTYDRTLLSLSGEAKIEGGFAVETLLKLEMSGRSESCLGMTSDDIYLFHNGTKQRFLGDKHLLYIDVALCEEGHHLVTAFSDMAGASFALAFGDTTGHVNWTHEIEGQISSVAMARQGNRVAVGTENGRIFLFDASRRVAWEFGTENPVRALAISRDGVYVAYGTRDGAIGLIDGDGMRKWEAMVQGEVTDLALDGDAQICALLYRSRAADALPNSVRLACIGATGQIEWQYDSEQNLLSVSLAANGKYLATGARGGTVAVYEVIFGENVASDSRQAVGGARRQAEALTRSGDLRGAARVLEIALEGDPTNLNLYEELIGLRNHYFESTLADALSKQSAGDPMGAIGILETLVREAPPASQVFTRAATVLSATRAGRVHQLRNLAMEQIQQEQDDLAEKSLREALALAPFDSREIRQELGVLRHRRARAAETEAERSATTGNIEAGVAFLERAQSIEPTQERAQKLAQMQIAMELAAGMAAYNAKQYPDAIFQFKKVLARDPSHSEARRYLTFAQKFSQDSSTDNLNDRFSRLE